MKDLLSRPGSLVAILLFVGLFLLGTAALNSADFRQDFKTVQVAIGIGAIFVAVGLIARRAVSQRRGDIL